MLARIVMVATLLSVVVACEKKPTAEEIQAQRAAEAARSPKPKPGDWMWDAKKRQNPLEKPAPRVN